MKSNYQQSTESLENENLKKQIHSQASKIRQLEARIQEVEQELESTKVDFNTVNNAEYYQSQLEQFTYIVAHDLQEPVRTMKSFAELLTKKHAPKLEAEALQFLNYITNSSNKLSDLINDLLDHSRIGRHSSLEIFNSNNSLINARNSLNLLIEQDGIIIESEDLPLIKAYRKEFKLLFFNLLDNALKFRKPNEKLVISIKVIQKEKFWEFSISDNGIGIQNDKLEDIFMVFRQFHPRNLYEGTGIGLAHCKKIIELYQGKIWATSEVGVGSTFYFTIPIINE